MDEVPALVTPTKTSKKKKIFIFLGIFLMTALIPLGVYLVNQRTQFLPQAAAPSQKNNEDISAELSLKASQTDINAGDKVEVDLNLSKSTKKANLFVARLNFQKDFFTVEKISSGSANLKWHDSSFDNNKGEITLIGGNPTPGLEDKDQILSKITLVAKKDGPTTLAFSEAKLFSNDSNEDILEKSNNLSLQINPIEPGLTLKTASPSASVSPQIVIQTPKLGQVFSYFKPMEIVWTSQDIEKIDNLSIYINNQNFGAVSTNFANSNKFSWEPQSTLVLPFITNDNIFQIGLSATSKKGEKNFVLSEPFGLSAQGKVANPPSTLDPDLNKDEVSDFKDLSALLTNYGPNPKDQNFDINKDGAINLLDLHLLFRQLKQPNSL